MERDGDFVRESVGLRMRSFLAISLVVKSVSYQCSLSFINPLQSKTNLN